MRNTPPFNILDMGHYETLPLDAIKPYWRNPRRVTEEAVNAVATSIRYYGYQQPIVVDTARVIIVGHTRYAALRRLGVKEVPVLVATGLSERAVKEYRLIDNKAGEMSFWDLGRMASEIEAMDEEVVNSFFPDMTDQAVEDANRDLDAEYLADEWKKVDNRVGFVCPECFHSFEVKVSREQVMSGVIEKDASHE